MNTDKKVLYTVTASTLAVLLVALFLPGEYSVRITAACLLIPIAVLSWYFIKKRSILSMNHKQILMLMCIIGVVLLMILYLTGLKFGFYKNPYADYKLILTHFLPTLSIIVAAELFRYVIRSQEDTVADVLCYISCVVAEALIYGNIHYINSFGRFMDFMAMTVFPAVISNLLYHYLSRRYGFYPNMAYRLITTLYIYIIPIEPAISDSLLSFARLFIPLGIYIFIDSLYERKIRYVLEKKSKFAVPITVLAVTIMIFTVMVVSNQFFIGAYVIATPSMTGELNVGDAAIYERYDDQTVEEGQVIVFENNDMVIIHRVVKIEIINGQTRYFTKGDANEEIDVGFIYDSNIIGLVNHKIPYIGYPTLWLRSLFDR